ncbi:hypothetical protein JCM9140_1367 [Halalkalibacter wakoensis JCM 9140]|uniref:Uncharacterized protein n=1 Tax=Halalkalibacter wakoensis JCM 9140 TaxID=1236970 RepID=W4PZW2_9BACI|nr:hypothetical protein JCM9140_1367 [Halalkalibacter wakoensis JCM 9140]
MVPSYQVIIIKAILSNDFIELEQETEVSHFGEQWIDIFFDAFMSRSKRTWSNQMYF